MGSLSAQGLEAAVGSWKTGLGMDPGLLSEGGGAHCRCESADADPGYEHSRSQKAPTGHPFEVRSPVKIILLQLSTWSEQVLKPVWALTASSGKWS